MFVHGLPRLYFEPLKLLSFDFNADPDPDFHSNADPDLCPASKYNADPDPQPCSVLYVGPHLETQRDKLNLRRRGSFYAETGF